MNPARPLARAGARHAAARVPVDLSRRPGREGAAAGGGTRRVDDALRSEAGGVSRRIAFVAARCVAPRAARGVRF